MTARFEIGGVLGRYRLLERLGGGGMGDVYRAEDPLLGREVAIKVAHTSGVAARERFLLEARHAARVVHPNLVGIFDLGIHEDEGFIAMELVHGTPLSQLARRGPSDWRIAAAIGEGIAAGLAALHQAQLVHRDVKPGNVMLGVSGVVKVVDFGIATSEDATADEDFVGTPGYIAPELILGQRPRRTADVFALGVVLHELVMSQRLFSGETPYARAMAVTQRTAPRLAAARAPDWFADLVEDCLAPIPEDRPRDAAEVLAVLRAHGPHPALGALARELRTQGDPTLASESFEEPTTVSPAGAPFVGRDALLLELGRRRARTVWLHGAPGSGKTRLVAELAIRCDAGAVLLVENAENEQALATALGLESALHHDALRLALQDLSPVLVALEDVSSDLAATERTIALVRREAPDALCLVTSDAPPSHAIEAEVIALEPLGPTHSEDLLLARLRQPRWTSARTLAPLAQGHPLTLALLALGIERADQSLDGIRGTDVLDALISRALVMLSSFEREVAERLAVTTDRGIVLLRASVGETVDAALPTLDAYGLIEMRESGPTMRRAVRASVLRLLTREGREDAVRRACEATLHASMLRLARESRGGSTEALRTATLLRPEIVAVSRRTLARPTPASLTTAVEMFHAALEPNVQKFDAAIALLERLVVALDASDAGDELRARARLAQAWALDDHLAEAALAASEAIRLGAAFSPLLAQALAALASIDKRRGRAAEAKHAFERVLEIAIAEHDQALAALARSDLAIGAMRQGDLAMGRALLGSEPTSLPLHRFTPRVAVNRALIAIEIGDIGRSIAECEIAVDAARTLGQSRFVVTGLVYLVEGRIRNGELEAAESAARQALLAARTTNASLPLLLVMNLLTMLALMRGDWQRALRSAQEAQRAVDASLNPLVVARAHALEAACLALVGEPGVYARVEAAEAIAPRLSASHAETVLLYASLARGSSGEDDALAALDARLAEKERSPSTDSGSRSPPA